MTSGIICTPSEGVSPTFDTLLGTHPSSQVCNSGSCARTSLRYCDDRIPSTAWAKARCPSVCTSKEIDSKTMRLVLGAAGLLVALLVLARVGFGLLVVALVVLWLVSPLVGALIWQRKGGSAVIGFLGGLFLGPLVLLMLLADPGKKKCPACASRIPKEAKVCGQCRQEVSTA
jgi:hypothetical protein